MKRPKKKLTVNQAYAIIMRNHCDRMFWMFICLLPECSFKDLTSLSFETERWIEQIEEEKNK